MYFSFHFIFAVTGFVLGARAQNEEATVVVRIHLIEFDSHGKDEDGDNCDLAIWGGSVKKCDPEFIFCVDRYNGGGSVSNCAYYKGTTRHWRDDDSVDFGSDMKGVPNPIIVDISAAQYEGIRFKVDVDDDDDTSADDDIDRFDWLVRLNPDPNFANATRHFESLRGERSRRPSDLDLYIWVYCGANSYGPDCTVYCVPKNNDIDGHYGCDLETGEQYCLDGWEGLNASCLVRVDNCDELSCVNGGVCVDRYDDFDCMCPAGYTGKHCEFEMDECEPEPCANGGTCTDMLNGYICLCNNFYAGTDCQYHMCEHPDTYCLNGGTCYELDNSTLACECPQQYAGIHCDVDACDILECVHGECIDGICECEPHFLGGLCDVRACDLFECQSGGTCLDDGTCTCTNERTGTYCEHLVSPCVSLPCYNGATCVAVSEFQAFQCRCPNGYNGTFCENTIPVDWGVKYDRVIDDSHEEETTGLPTWALALMVAVAILCLIIVIIVTIMLKYRRKYKKTVHERDAAASAPRDMDNFVNPLYDTETPPTIAYSASAESATINTTTKKGVPEEEEYGDSHPPPYTTHAGDMSGIPLPSYEQSQERGAVAFVNEGYTGSSNNDDDIPIKVDCPEGDNIANDDVTAHIGDVSGACGGTSSSGNGGYMSPRNVREYNNPTYAALKKGNNLQINTNNTDKKEPIYDEVKNTLPRSRGQTTPTSANGDPLYAEIPSNRPIGTSENGVALSDATRDSTNVDGNTNHAFDSSSTDNEVNASLEGSNL